MMDNFIYEFKVDESICDELIKYHKENSEHKFTGSIVDSKGKETIIKYFNALKVACSEYCLKYDLNEYDADFTNLIQYYPKNGGFKKWHNERPAFGNSQSMVANRALVYMTYLNTVTDKGETEFKYQKIKYKAVKGKSLIWPTDFTHTHRGIPSPTQEKWIATGWYIIL